VRVVGRLAILRAFRPGSAEVGVHRCEADVLDPESWRVGYPRDRFGSEWHSKFLSIPGINFGLISD
jgi:hypothetical protein